MKRRTFLKRFLIVPLLLTGFSKFLIACGAKSGNTATAAPSTGGDCTANGTEVTIGSNHGHTVSTISSADVTTGTQQTYGLDSGSAGHTHTYTVSAANFTTLQGNNGVLITSDADGTGHTHAVTIDCA